MHREVISQNQSKLQSKLRLTAAEILAAAVSDYAPNAYMIRGGETPWGFYYDFIFNAPFSEEMLPLIEERMRQIASENLEIKIHEMIHQNAADFLRHHRRLYAAHFAEICSAPLVQVMQMGEFVDHIHGSCLPTSGELKVFKLLGISQRPDLTFRGDKKKVFRIYGTAFQDKGELKTFMRQKEKWLSNTHKELGEKMGLFRFQLFRSSDYFEKAEVFWTGEGEKIVHSLKEFWRKIHLKEGFELIQTSGINLTESHQNFYEQAPSSEQPFCIAEMRPPVPGGELTPLEGFFTAEHVHRDCAHIFCSKKHLREKLISSLKFLEKIPRMFQLECKTFASSPQEFRNILEETFDGKVQEGKKGRVEWNLKDGYGRYWKGPSLSLEKWRNGYLIKISAYSSLERLIALILEWPEKDLSQKKEFLSKIVSLDE